VAAAGEYLLKQGNRRPACRAATPRRPCCSASKYLFFVPEVGTQNFSKSPKEAQFTEARWKGLIASSSLKETRIRLLVHEQGTCAGEQMHVNGSCSDTGHHVVSWRLLQQVVATRTSCSSSCRTTLLLPWDISCCAAEVAAQHGHLQVLQWLATSTPSPCLPLPGCWGVCRSCSCRAPGCACLAACSAATSAMGPPGSCILAAAAAGACAHSGPAGRLTPPACLGMMRLPLSQRAHVEAAGCLPLAALLATPTMPMVRRRVLQPLLQVAWRLCSSCAQSSTAHRAHGTEDYHCCKHAVIAEIYWAPDYLYEPWRVLTCMTLVCMYAFRQQNIYCAPESPCMTYYALSQLPHARLLIGVVTGWCPLQP